MKIYLIFTYVNFSFFGMIVCLISLNKHFEDTWKLYLVQANERQWCSKQRDIAFAGMRP